MSASRHKIVYQDFKGEYGAWAGDKIPPGTFHAKNMQVYKTGFLGPRAGLRALAYTSVPGATVRGMGWRGTTAKDLWVAFGTDVQYNDTLTIGNAFTDFSANLASTPTHPVQGVEYGNSNSFITNFDDKSYILNHTTGTLTAIATAPGGACCALYGERMMVASTTAQPTRVYFSNAGDFTTWGAGSFFDLPASVGSVAAMFQQRNGLTILTLNGEWWVLTGVPGSTNAFLRRVGGGGVHPWIMNPNAAWNLGSDEVMFVPIRADYPATFNGSYVSDTLRHLEINGGTPYTGDTDIKVIRGGKPEEAVILFPSAAPAKAALLTNDVWTFMEFDQALSVYVASDGQGRIIFTDGANPAKFWTWTLDLDRPAFSTDTLQARGDGSNSPLTDNPVDASVLFPEYWAPDGTEIRVRAVTVDFWKYDTSGAAVDEQDVGFTATATTISRYLNQDTPSSSIGFTQSGAIASVDGIKDRHVFRFGTASEFGGGFSVGLYSVMGVAIERVIVEYESRDVPRT
jgi:hypothetical protein